MHEFPGDAMCFDVDQAIYGERRSGHQLLAQSGAAELAAELTGRLDLPDTAPRGVNWSPYLSGFAYKDRYVLARTFLDHTAPRTGMVLTHALLIPLDKVGEIPALESVLNALISEPQKPMALLPLKVCTCAHLPAAHPDLEATAVALASVGSGPVVCLGHIGFESLVAALWLNLSPNLRAKFSFRLSFGPSDLIERPAPDLICTPVSLLSRWTGHRIINGPRPMASRSLAAALLMGLPDGLALKEFATSIGATIARFPDLILLERAFD